MDGIINEIFSKYQIRKTKKQKTAFIDFAIQKITEEGYSVVVENGSLGVRNIVVGNPDTAKVVYTAHYDTCPRLPFPNFLTPKSIGVYLLYNLAIVLGFLAIAIAVGVFIGAMAVAFDFSSDVGATLVRIVYFALLIATMLGPANKHTANDNTSGVTVLFGIIKALPKEYRDSVAFVFFDCEEMGLLGSSSFAKKHKSVKNGTLLINFDCVSDGKDVMVLAQKAAEQYRDTLAAAYVSNDGIEVEVTNKAFYPSDQSKFKKGVGVAVFKRTKGGMLYINKIHTNKDTVFQRENIDFLVSCSVKLAELL